MKALYGMMKKNGLLESDWTGRPQLWITRHSAVMNSKIMGTKAVRVKVEIITPPRKATIARTEGKKMAKAKEKAPSKKPAKKGKC